MLIKQGYWVKNLYLQNRKSPITYTYGGAHSIKVSLKHASKKKSPRNNGDDKSICHAWGSFKPSEKIKKYFVSISNNELPSEMSNDPEVLEYFNDTAKTVERIHIKYFPQPFQDYLRNVRTELRDIIKRTVDIFMWRCGIHGGHNPLSGYGMSFSFDGKIWYGEPPGATVSFSSFAIHTPPEQVAIIIRKLIKSKHDQPLGHQMFREAQSLRTSNPRISIIVAMSALEVAAKECISKLNPESIWLVENLPSPDVRKLINEYIPRLLCKTTLEGILPLPESLNTSIRKGVTVRNRIIHLGHQAPSGESTDEMLSAIQEVIWILDYCCGYDWALRFISRNSADHIMSKIKTSINNPIQ
ncbi:MAG: hypothetical protein KKE17_10700 [Proteobacteria bacterium]|nr:hypothetical protein [Pseudomonadota bacterium]MBU1710461.1 hypothetical protein [Pseudomonadota bacterium]